MVPKSLLLILAVGGICFADTGYNPPSVEVSNNSGGAAKPVRRIKFGGSTNVSVSGSVATVTVSGGTPLPAGDTSYIQNSSTLQSGSVFNVSSGSVSGNFFSVGGSTFTVTAGKIVMGVGTPGASTTFDNIGGGFSAGTQGYGFSDNPGLNGGMSASGSTLRLAAAGNWANIEFGSPANSNAYGRIVGKSPPDNGWWCLGGLNCNATVDINGPSFIVDVSSTPGTSSSACTAGTIQWDTSFIYLCTTTNTWKRVTLASF